MAIIKGALSIPSQTPFCNPSNGVVTQEWRLWFNKLYQRNGGTDALSNLELEDEINNSNAIITDLSSRVVILEGNVTDLTNQVTQNTNAITSINSQVIINTSDISVLQSQVSIINSNISSLNANTIQTITNIGTGIGIYKDKNSNNANLKSLKAGTNVTLDNSTNVDEIVINTVLPIASTTVAGVVKVDGTTITISGGVISAAGGGGGLTNFTEGNNNTGLNATRTVSFLNATNAATDVDIAIVPKGAASFALSVTNGLTSGGNKRGIYAVDLLLNRGNASHVASGIWSCLIGGYNNTASGNASGVFAGGLNTVSSDDSVILGGNSNNITVQESGILGGTSNQIISSSYNSVILAGATNTIQNNSGNSSILAGTNNTITSTSMYCTIAGGTLNTIDGSSSAVILGGNANNALNASFSNILAGSSNSLSFAAYAVIVHGLSNTANARYSSAEGYCSNTKGIVGAKVRSNLSFSNVSDGKTQHGEYDIGGETISSNTVDLTTNKNTGGTNNQMIIPEGEIRTMFGDITIRDKGTNAIARIYEIKVKARNVAGTVTILTSNILSVFADPTAVSNGYALVASVDTTNIGVKFTVNKTGGGDVVAFGTLRTIEFNY